MTKVKTFHPDKGLHHFFSFFIYFAHLSKYYSCHTEIWWCQGKTLNSCSHFSVFHPWPDLYADFSALRLKPSPLPKIKLWECEEYQAPSCFGVHPLPTITLIITISSIMTHFTLYKWLIHNQKELCTELS